MDILRTGLGDVQDARGVAIVIDVFRAFSVAAYALGGDAQRLWCVRTTEEALALRALEPQALLAGEIHGRIIEGFDLNNSPSRMALADVRDRTIIQRTGAGTQGAVGASHVPHLFVCSLLNARATAQRAGEIARAEKLPLTLVVTGTGSPESIEDDACADYLDALIRKPVDADTVLRTGLKHIRATGRLDPFTADDSDFPADDVLACLAVDRFDFVMRGRRKEAEGVVYVEVVRE